MSGSTSYKSSGVDTEEGQRFVKQISRDVESTYNSSVVRMPGGYGGLYDISELKNYKQPILVHTNDGVGTKLHLARLFDRHETIGVDLVAMCSNDLLVLGAKPIGFLDYIACGKLDTQKMASVLGSIADGCRQASCALLGGETAEHPGIMEDDEYDLGGFMTGVVEKGDILTGQNIEVGDCIIGIPSSGLHSNGFSLIRKIFLKKEGLELPASEAERAFLLNQILLRPTIIYEGTLRSVIQKKWIKGLVHVTGGGFRENIPRILPTHLTAMLTDLEIPAFFKEISSKGNIPIHELYSVFNMGYGMIVFAKASDADQLIDSLNHTFPKEKALEGMKPKVIGKVVEKQKEPVVIQ